MEKRFSDKSILDAALANYQRTIQLKWPEDDPFKKLTLERIKQLRKKPIATNSVVLGIKLDAPDDRLRSILVEEHE